MNRSVLPPFGLDLIKLSFELRVFHCLLPPVVTVSLQNEQLVDLLLNTIMLSVPISGSHSHNFLSFSHGEYFYSLFQVTINTELLRSLDTTVPRLMKASSQNPSMVALSPLFYSHSEISYSCDVFVQKFPKEFPEQIYFKVNNFLWHNASQVKHVHSLTLINETNDY